MTTCQRFFRLHVRGVLSQGSQLLGPHQKVNILSLFLTYVYFYISTSLPLSAFYVTLFLKVYLDMVGPRLQKMFRSGAPKIYLVQGLKKNPKMTMCIWSTCFLPAAYVNICT